ncbi:MAG: glycoside hydrolase family 10 protein [Flammeovirgaceae bacterium]
MYKQILVFLVSLLILIPNLLQGQQAPKREFRGVWVSTIHNIDWPPKKGLWKQAQQEAFLQLLDEHQKAGINAVIFQVRPASDAFYRSKNEPWSEWLTGEQGEKPGFDPLKFVISECHKRNMELHAWFNPFRAFAKGQDSLSKKHISRRHPEWLVDYHYGKYINPGIPEARKYLVKEIMSVVKKYDIDGVHFDDYFYPYPVNGQPFEDNHTYKTHANGFTDKGDWRRANINNFIKTLHINIEAEKKHVKFGISPFGVWRNKKDDPLGSDTYASIPSYDSIYADTKLWLDEGWIDYIAPQIYWSTTFKPAAFNVLIPWWADNAANRHVYIGHAVYKINNNYDSAWYNPEEMPDQIKLVRNYPKEIQGSIFFRSKFLNQNPGGINTRLKEEFYAQPALLPTMYWKDAVPPLPPRKVRVIQEVNGVTLKWKRSKKAPDGQRAAKYVIYRYPKGTAFSENDSNFIVAIVSAKQKSWFDPQRSGAYEYRISALDRSWNETFSY